MKILDMALSVGHTNSASNYNKVHSTTKEFLYEHEWATILQAIKL